MRERKWNRLRICLRFQAAAESEKNEISSSEFIVDIEHMRRFEAAKESGSSASDVRIDKINVEIPWRFRPPQEQG